MTEPTRKTARPPVWHGTAVEASELVTAAAHHCACALDARGNRLKMCPSHTMVFTDQRALDGLLFARRLRDRFQAAEFARQVAPPA